MDLISYLVSDPSEWQHGKKLMDELVASPYPNYLYGAGNMATDYLVALDKYNIPIAGVVVDEKYYNPGSKLGRHEIKPIEGLADVDRQVNIIIAFDESIENIRSKIPKQVRVNKLYHIDIGTLYDRNSHLTYQYVRDHFSNFQRVYDMCSDTYSQKVICNYINTKITGNPEFLMETCTHDIYFPKDIIVLSDKEIFVDCGAYNGDTIMQFLKETNREYQKIYAFEPDEHNIRMLENTIDCFKVDRIVVCPKGAWDKKETLKFRSYKDESMMSSFVETGMSNNKEDVELISVNVTSLDSAISTKEEVSYIKMDIEGSELRALEGAREIIQRCKPKLAISAYHLKDDIYKIPLYLKSLNPNYKIYFRHHHYISYDLVCYAIP